MIRLRIAAADYYFGDTFIEEMVQEEQYYELWTFHKQIIYNNNKR